MSYMNESIHAWMWTSMKCTLLSRITHVWHDSLICDIHTWHASFTDFKPRSYVTWLMHLSFPRQSHRNLDESRNIRMSHATCKCVISNMHESYHIWPRHVTYEWVMTRMDVTYEWGMSHMSKSCHMRMRHVMHSTPIALRPAWGTWHIHESYLCNHPYTHTPEYIILLTHSRPHIQSFTHPHTPLNICTCSLVHFRVAFFT